MLSIYVFATCILPHRDLAKHIENNTVGIQHLLQKRNHLMDTTWLQFQTEDLQYVQVYGKMS